ncbi:MAG TPA: 2-C-methyl-D-erythritol 4-phosphate cytidylyltransferase [Burkholderiales bacterium]|nr:2-C-methyl-D-erythritol 4-phosphate cytidylyltransferase [Burkholderiales bacterium]
MPDIYALIPAAGSGSRMGSEIPKQYQLLAGKPLIHYAIDVLCTHAQLRQVFLVLAPQDQYFKAHDWSAYQGRLQPLYCGGATRAASVLNGLMAMADAVDADDWVLVHDAARPCVSAMLIDRLLSEVSDDKVGGLLALPVADTLKRADSTQRAIDTTPREDLWQAQTPQVFRYRLLLEALRSAKPGSVTDEASAIEQMGLRPRLVMGSSGNHKVTWPADFEFAEKCLKTNTYK